MHPQVIGKSSNGAGLARTKEYVTLLGGLQLRPNGRMPLSSHEEAGRLLKDVHVATMLRYPIYKPVNAARAMLEDWASCEHPDVPNYIFLNLYYFSDNWPDVPIPRGINEEERARHIASLRKVQEIVVTHYPDCKPLRTLLKRIDDAVKALNAWR